MTINSTNARKAPGSRVLERYAASELLAQELKNEILDGTLRPGESLREIELTERYGVARNTVREALRLLTRDGLGTHEVHRGVTVRVYSPEEVADIFRLRGVLEETAAIRAGSLTETEIGHLERVLVESEDAFRTGDARAGLNANLAFHRELVALFGNQRMNEVFAQLLTEIRLILASMEEQSGGHWLHRNRELLSNLVDGDAKRFRRNLTKYIDQSLSEATRTLPSTN